MLQTVSCQIVAPKPRILSQVGVDDGTVGQVFFVAFLLFRPIIIPVVPQGLRNNFWGYSTEGLVSNILLQLNEIT